jgi:hypothetical protein
VRSASISSPDGVSGALNFPPRGGGRTSGVRPGDAPGADSRGDGNPNTAESSFALVKRGLYGIYHAVRKDHLHRYLAEYDFRWNTRMLNDGQRTTLAIRGAEGKRLQYRNPGTSPSLTGGQSPDKQRACMPPCPEFRRSEASV